MRRSNPPVLVGRAKFAVFHQLNWRASHVLRLNPRAPNEPICQNGSLAGWMKHAVLILELACSARPALKLHHDRTNPPAILAVR